ncbi:peptidase S16 [Shewanella maritima]|uniref:Peptidase S16 n=1 Tax=Shewanella maritima TaxID=2520507 RepID=A0A411PLR5_9GAMM|nr:LON peptidase substrate-binding domain-containing protein [Shewanella maritima]QBF84472.1 peptidase S16 [Shewanella maritima]
MNIALFPLSICILPNGYTQLRIFEPRYLRMISEAMKQQRQFAMAMANKKGSLLRYATIVTIVDFDNLEDNTLSITIKGESLVAIQETKREPDGLLVAKVSEHTAWQATPIQSNDGQEEVLKQKLVELFEQYPQHRDLYPQCQFDDISWICQRWLEVLPLTAEQKQQCIGANSHIAAQSLINQIILSE